VKLIRLTGLNPCYSLLACRAVEQERKINFVADSRFLVNKRNEESPCFAQLLTATHGSPRYVMYGLVQPYRRAMDNSEWSRRADRVLLCLSLHRTKTGFDLCAKRHKPSYWVLLYPQDYVDIDYTESLCAHLFGFPNSFFHFVEGT
jgi:hypothetical protein